MDVAYAAEAARALATAQIYAMATGNDPSTLATATALPTVVDADVDNDDQSTPSRRGRGKRSRSRSRSRSRRSSRRRSRSRDRHRRRRHRSRDDDYDHRGSEATTTVMLRGLAQHIVEDNIRQSVQATLNNVEPKDIRLIRKRETGASRGFAFVEFHEVQEAQQWMDANEGVLIFEGRFRAVMSFTDPGEYRGGGDSKGLSDWICPLCGVRNFRRREVCFKCNGPRVDSEPQQNTFATSEISTEPSLTLILMGLDTLTTEETVTSFIRRVNPSSDLKSVQISRDSLTQTSQGICYVTLSSVVQAMHLYNHFITQPVTIDERVVSVAYCKETNANHRGSGLHQHRSSRRPPLVNSKANAALEAAQWSHKGEQQQQQNDNFSNESEIDRMAEYSASLYAKTREEKMKYLEYYREYYRKNGIHANESQKTSYKDSPSSSTKKSKKNSTLGKVVVEGKEYQKYPTPDPDTFVFDASSGYYFDSSTSLYYDAKSQYYYSSSSGGYVYWSPQYETYLPVKQQQQKVAVEGGECSKSSKSAKKIAKQMEKWANIENSKRLEAQASSSTSAAPTSRMDTPEPSITTGCAAGSEDVAYSLFQSQQSSNQPAFLGTLDDEEESLRRQRPKEEDEEKSRQRPNEATPKDEPEMDWTTLESTLTDWLKLACLLCKRQFATKEKLAKHNQVSDLHKQNLALWREQQGGDNNMKASNNSTEVAVGYRDRAKERREKYGVNETVRPNEFKQSYLAAMEASQSVANTKRTDETIEDDNVGNRMLLKMGWKQGLGLGKSNQGRTDIVKAEQRSGHAGLGSSGQTVKAHPNEDYRQTAKRAMFQRYKDL